MKLNLFGNPPPPQDRNPQDAVTGDPLAQAMVERIAAMDFVQKRSSLVKLHDAAGQQPWWNLVSCGLHVSFSHGDRPTWSYSGFGDDKSYNL